MGDDAHVIVALATPWGRAALAVVRLSGADCHEVCARFTRPRRGRPVPTGRPRRVDVLDTLGHVVDDGVLLLGAGPATPTGEDTAELTIHGNPVVVQAVLEAAVGAGARMAAPGDFTRRALLHGKLDLVAAEGVLALSEATSPEGVRIARAGLDGRLSTTIAGLREALLDGAAELEAWLDHPDDALAYVDEATLVDALAGVARQARALAATHQGAQHLVRGARVALVGAVNAGKSSLFNALLGRSRALVHATPGTTRDVVEATALLDGVAVTLLDTAGERVTADPVEAAGLALAAELVDEADLVVVVLRARPEGPDATEAQLLERTAGRARLVVVNGVDSEGQVPEGALPTVAPSGQGVSALRSAIRAALVGELPGDAALVVASVRQRDLLLEVARAVDEAIAALPVAGIAVAADAVIRAAETLDALTGADTRDDVLSALFRRFCIGK